MFAVDSKSDSRLPATKLLHQPELTSSSQNSASRCRPALRPLPSVDLVAVSRRHRRHRLARGAELRRPATTRRCGCRRRRRLRGRGHRSAARCFSGTPDGRRGRSASTRVRRLPRASLSHRMRTPASGSTKPPRTAIRTSKPPRHRHRHRINSSRKP